ncbi:MAG TPA: hypothetical protein VIL46_10470, partial [Gemmataceae bacterium]
MTAIDPTKTHLAQELKHDSPLLACRFDPAGRFLFAAAQDNTLQRFELEGGKKTPLAGHVSWVRAITFAGEMLITADYAGAVKWWPVDGDKPESVRSVEAHQGWVRAIAASPDGKLIATCGNDCMVRLWSAEDGRLVRELTGHDCHVYNVAFHPKENRLVSADLKGKVKDWDLAAGALVRELDASALYKYDPSFRADIGGARGIGFSPDGALLACAGITEVSNAFAGVGKPLVVLFDWSSGKGAKKLQPKDDFQGTCWGVAIHPDGFVVGAGGGNGGMLWFWKPSEEKSFHAVKLPRPARDMALHPDGVR